MHGMPADKYGLVWAVACHAIGNGIKYIARGVTLFGGKKACTMATVAVTCGYCLYCGSGLPHAGVMVTGCCGQLNNKKQAWYGIIKRTKA